jgi:predicted nucleic acid-binding protein
VQDHEKHAKAAGRLFDACDRGEVIIVMLPTVLAEYVFVLESWAQSKDEQRLQEKMPFADHVDQLRAGFVIRRDRKCDTYKALIVGATALERGVT